MCDKELLVGYLYDELPPAERSNFEAHLFSCAECREEISGLRETRAYLGSWAPPEPDLGFQIVRAPAGAVASARRFRIPPAWGVAAAAALVLAAAAAIANLEVSVGSDGFVVRSGWARVAAPAMPAADPASAAIPAAAASVNDEALRAEVRRLRDEVRQLASASATRDAAPQARVAGAPGSRASDADLMRQMRKLVAESEARQDREIALRFAQFIKEEDMQRRADLMRVQQALGRLEAYTGAEAAQQREMINRIVRVSQGR